MIALVIVAVQMTLAFHVPANETDAMRANVELSDDCHEHESQTMHHHVQNGASDCDDTTATGNDCASDCADESCSNCCHHVPMVSPLPVPQALAFSFASPYSAYTVSSLLSKSIPAPFQPPRA